jgi:hypothetical protein
VSFDALAGEGSAFVEIDWLFLAEEALEASDLAVEPGDSEAVVLVGGVEVRVPVFEYFEPELVLADASIMSRDFGARFDAAGSDQLRAR